VRQAIYILFAVAYILLSSQQISLRKSPDLGRALRDGELVMAGETAVLHQNFYSYTNPAAEFSNHHWLSELLAYGASKAVGWEGLNLCYVALGAVAFLLYFRIGEHEAGLPVTAPFAAALMPLMIVRSGVRPEVFSMLLLAVFFTILWRVHRRTLPARWLWLLPVLEMLWVNFHAGFALGPVIIGTFLAAELIDCRETGWAASASKLSTLAAILVLTILAGLVNPNGIRGLLFPVTVSSNYGMDVQENLSMFRLQDTPVVPIMEIAILFLAGVWVMAYRRRVRIEWPLLLLSGSFGLMSLVFYRIYVFAGGFLLVAICLNIARFRASPKTVKAKKKEKPSTAWVGWIWAAALCGIFAFAAPRWNNAGLGLEAGDADLSEFLHTNHIAGKVFNGFANGAYLIHYLPEQKVYIDSRPEAYPAAFVRDDYTRALQNEDAWRRIVAMYDFDFICFIQMNREEGQFILRRLQDPEWAAVRAASDVVLVRRKPQFADVIAKHQLRF
jgi:hypothetical protein